MNDERLLHELRVHEIELEMQNVTLRESQIAIEESRDRYRQLYDFAPVGYFTLTEDGLIYEVNLTGATLLGVERNKLLQRSFTKFVSANDQTAWYLYFNQALQQGGKQQYNLSLRHSDGSFFHAHLDSLQSEPVSGKKSLRIALIDISEQHRLENDLRESRQLLRKLAENTEIIREQERKRIALEVHDELGQILTALRMDVTFISMSFGAQNAALQDKTQAMTALLECANVCVRNIVSDLRPAALDMGIIAAIRWLCKEYSARTGILFSFKTSEDYIELNEGIAVAIFRIIQELLTNTVRHAEASNVQIALKRYADDLYIQVRDNGKGFDSESKAKNNSFGLMGIHERINSLRGNIKFSSNPNKGTEINLIIPINVKLA